MNQISRLILPLLLTAVLGYLLGSVSFSIILTRIFKNEDIRNHGSGNAGMTNVLRTVGKLPAVLTFILDFLKCVLSVTLGYLIVSKACEAAGLPESYAVVGKYAAGFACLFGHIFPVYFGFRGGKGVVTSAAMVLLLDYRVFIPTFITFAIVFLLKRIISLSSIVAVSLYPVYTFLINFFFDCELSPLTKHGDMAISSVISLTIASLLISMIVVIVHSANIKRLCRGEEKPISFKGAQ